MSKRHRLKVTPAQRSARHDDLVAAGKDAFEEMYGPITDWMLDEEFRAFEAKSAKKARQHRYKTKEIAGRIVTTNTEHRVMTPETKARRRGRRA